MGVLTDCARKLGKEGGLKTQKRYRARKRQQADQAVGRSVIDINNARVARLARAKRDKQRDEAHRNQRDAGARRATPPAPFSRVPNGTKIHTPNVRRKHP